ncbi:dihydropteroate synthase, partial [Klebsiella pneumoniae]
VDAAIAAGIDRRRIIVDPGIGFSKTSEHNWQLMNAVDAFQEGFADLRVLWGVSRKRFLGELLAQNGEDRPALERDASTMALSTYFALHHA